MSSIETDLKPTFEEESRRRAERNDDERHEAATIERDIDATRADVRATLAALERRLSFDRLVEMTVGRIRERGGEFAGNLTDTATQNPVPVLLTSIGLGWMMLMSRRGAGNGSDRQPSRMRARAAEAMDGVGERFNEASERVRGYTMPSIRRARPSARRRSRCAPARAGPQPPLASKSTMPASAWIDYFTSNR
jgi:hypothetical protein